MCGRFALFASESEIVDHFGLKMGFMMKSRYNIAPSQVIPVLLENAKQIDFSHWGFLPPWTKHDEENPKGYINARIETIMEKPAFKNAFLQRRCLIPVSGYYEWAVFGKKKQPYFFQQKSKTMMAFAGIWSVWQGKQAAIHSCAILTKSTQGDLQKIHERMPIIVPQSKYHEYLSSHSEPAAIKTFIEKNETTLDYYAVSSFVSNAKSEGIECITKI